MAVLVQLLKLNLGTREILSNVASLFKKKKSSSNWTFRAIFFSLKTEATKINYHI